MKRFWPALLIFLLPVLARGGEVSFSIDYFGCPIKMLCEVEEAGGADVSSFTTLVSRDESEIGDCMKSLLDVSVRHDIRGYAQALLFWRFVESLPGGDKSSDWTSFADAVRGRGLSRNDKIALLYVMLGKAGYGVEVKRTGREHFLVVKLDHSIPGFSWSPLHYTWEPGHEFYDEKALARFHSAYDVLAHEGAAMTFDSLPDVNWEMTAPGREVSFKSPDGCPDQWAFKVRRLPGYEEFLALWPREYEIMGLNAGKMLEPFGFEQRFRPAMGGMDNEDFGNCVFQWVQLNLPYDYPHSKEPPATRITRNPVETLMVYKKGVCSELSMTLVGLLLDSGFPPDYIKIAQWDKGTARGHINIAVAPLSGDLGSGTYFTDRKNGRKYYLMDPAYRITGNRLGIKWGDLHEDYEKKQAILMNLGEK